MDSEVVAPEGSGEQHAEAHSLADGGGKGCALRTHTEPVDKQRIEHDVQQCAADNAEHGIQGVALKTELVVQTEGAGHHRRGGENPAQVVRRGLEKRGVSAQKAGDRFREELACQRHQAAQKQGQKQAGGSHFRGLVHVLPSQRTGDEVRSALPDEEAEGLNQRHHRQRHRNRRNGAGPGVAADGADKICICYIVKRCHQHGGNGGQRKPKNKLLDRGRGHSDQFLLPEIRTFCTHGAS